MTGTAPLADDQAAILDFLARPGSYPGSPAVERIDTHTASIFLAGDRAYKLKRAVRYDYLDFSTADRRRALSEAEVAVNRRTAPDLYLGVEPVTRDAAGALAIGGRGEPLDWLVVMARFPQDALADRLAARGDLTLDLMPPLGEAVARLHADAARRTDHGGVAGMRWVVDGNAEAFEADADVLPPVDTRRLTAASRAEIDRVAGTLDRRRQHGAVRECHGDLHLRNIVVLDGRPVLFDGVEFNDEIACVDVWYDTAFLLMDLGRRRLPVHANRVFNAYLLASGDLEGLALLPLFLSCRAAVRAKTSVSAARLQADRGRVGELHAAARDYLATAERLLRPDPPVLVAIGGLSGSGKSTLAAGLAPGLGRPPGAAVFRSDVVRKTMLGQPLDARLASEDYTLEVTQRVYAELRARCAATLAGGHSAIADAVFRNPAEREAIERVARDAGVPFVGLWLDAPDEVLMARIAERRGDPSDATAVVLERQTKYDRGTVTWTRVDARGTPDEVRRRAARHVPPADAPAPRDDAPPTA